jgi:coatomer subunit beta
VSLVCSTLNLLIIGEDALANLSVEKDDESGKITGHVRIRSKGQGMALSLGQVVVR